MEKNENGRGKGFGFVCYDSREAAAKVCEWKHDMLASFPGPLPALMLQAEKQQGLNIATQNHVKYLMIIDNVI